MSRQVRKFFTYEDPIVPMQGPRTLIEIAVGQGADREALLEHTGINLDMLESPDARISLRQHYFLNENALRLTNNPALGLDVGMSFNASRLGILGLVSIASPDVRTALDFGLKYYRAWVPFWDLSLEVEGDVAWIVARESIPLQPHRVFATEILLSSYLALARSLLSVELPMVEVRFNFPRPAHADRYREITTAPIFFDQPDSRAAFEAWLLDEKLSTADPVTLKAAERQCAADIAAAAAASSEGLLAEVRAILGSTPGKYPDPAELARKLRTSERSLRRRLQQMGTSYSEQLDEVRRQHAIEHVVGTNLSINDIAYRLGFADGRSFRRAFKRWTGTTALQYRKATG